MLQQTQVATVIPYFVRFLGAFPSIASLARAEESDVLRYWEGLGYYHRARNLHRSARIVLENHAGEFPDDPATVRRLPGLGRYTTGAILSQAFDRRLPILEANSIRVLCRLFGLEGDPRRHPLHRQLWQIAEEILPRTQVGDFNQALMELGALVCTVRDPDCKRCPVRQKCVARREGRQSKLPTLPARPTVVEQEETALVIWRKQRVLILQRPSRGRWGGLWEFPHFPVAKSDESRESVSNLVQQQLGLTVKAGPRIAVVRHGITHHRIRMTCLEADLVEGDFKSNFYVSAKWVTPDELPEYPFSSPQRRLAAAIGRPRQVEFFD